MENGFSRDRGGGWPLGHRGRGARGDGTGCRAGRVGEGRAGGAGRRREGRGCRGLARGEFTCWPGGGVTLVGPRAGPGAGSQGARRPSADPGAGRGRAQARVERAASADRARVPQTRTGARRTVARASATPLRQPPPRFEVRGAAGHGRREMAPLYLQHPTPPLPCRGLRSDPGLKPRPLLPVRSSLGSE